MAGVKGKSGRNPVDNPRDNRLTIKLTDLEVAEWKRRAGMVPLSTWVRSYINLNEGIPFETYSQGDAKNE